MALGFGSTLPGGPNFCAVIPAGSKAGTAAGYGCGLFGLWLNFVCCLLCFLLFAHVLSLLVDQAGAGSLCWLCRVDCSPGSLVDRCARFVLSVGLLRLS